MSPKRSPSGPCWNENVRFLFGNEAIFYEFGPGWPPSSLIRIVRRLPADRRWFSQAHLHLVFNLPPGSFIKGDHTAC